jgi:hypothetical protein
VVSSENVRIATLEKRIKTESDPEKLTELKIELEILEKVLNFLKIFLYFANLTFNHFSLIWERLNQ